jgi:hypothetical protein
MAINQRSNKPPINITGSSSMIWLRGKNGYASLVIPVAFDLKTMLIEPTTAIAMAHFIRVVVLKCFLIHKTPSKETIPLNSAPKWAKAV